MQTIEKNEFYNLIDETHIQRKHSANVYIWANAQELGISFAYSDQKNDEIILQRISIEDCDSKELLWLQLNEIAKEISNKYNVHIVIDDVRN